MLNVQAGDEGGAYSIVEATSLIVSSFVANNKADSSHLPELIRSVHVALHSLSLPPPREPLVPAVPINRSVKDDHIVCLEDGKKFRSLRRHLMAHYNMTPDEYRRKWGLPADYPMVAPAYSRKRSELARAAGLGRKEATES
jgi:predicted transcriptional regulator